MNHDVQNSDQRRNADAETDPLPDLDALCRQLRRFGVRVFKRDSAFGAGIQKVGIKDAAFLTVLHAFFAPRR
jgi:hypothetical protein